MVSGASECYETCATPDVCTSIGCRKLRARKVHEVLGDPLEGVSVPFKDISWVKDVEIPQEFSPPYAEAHWMRDLTGTPEPNTYEADIVAKYSTPGLKKFELTRFAKKEQLNAQGMSKYPEDRDKILEQLYPKG